MLRKIIEIGHQAEKDSNGKDNSEEINEFFEILTNGHTRVEPGRGRRNTAKRYKNTSSVICAFDIETTTLKDIKQSFMYLWQFAFMLENSDIYCIVGHDPETCKRFFERLTTTTEMKIIIFVHNLSYEFHFIRDFLEFTDVFSVKKRKILKATHKNLEFRCSYLLTNVSLAKFLKDYGVDHQKLEMDYSELRYPWTKIDKEDIKYGVHDVVGLVEAIKKRMEVAGDTLLTIPLTSTGYVRRDAKNAMKYYNYKQLRDLLPDLEVMELLQEEFRGGDTHANRYYVGKVIKDVESWDRSSSYPDRMTNAYFPMTRFKRLDYKVYEDDIFLKMKHGKALLFRVAISGLRQKNIFYGCPYISLSKCRKITDYVLDNGRILSADYLETTLNDIDYEIIKNEYTWDDISFFDVFECKYKKLPEQLVELIIKLYGDKTSLKGIEGKELDYALSKEKINSCYGMAAQNPLKDEVEYTPKEDTIFSVIPINKEEVLESYNKKTFLSYAWGCWVTSHARLELKKMINIVGNAFIYSDTDSVKVKSSLISNDIRRKIEKYNDDIIKTSIENGAYATDKKGNTHYMGVYEYEGKYKKFKTLGAKKYAYETEDGEIHITIAGVNKYSGAKEIRSLDELKEGFIFRNGGSSAVYNDQPYGTIEVDGHKLYIGTNIYIKNNEYRVGITEEYYNLLNNIDTKSFQKLIDKLNLT